MSDIVTYKSVYNKSNNIQSQINWSKNYIDLHQFQAIPSKSIDNTSIGGLGTDFGKWQGGVLAPNGKIYFVPGTSPSVAILDPKTNTLDTSTITGLGSGFLKWFGGILAPNEKIYCIPDQPTTDSVLIIDPKTDTVDTTTITGITSLPRGPHGWKSGCLHPNGKIYCAPYDSTTVLVIDPTTNTVDNTEIIGLCDPVIAVGERHYWHGGVLAPNGKIYFIPLGQSFLPLGRVLIVDPTSPITSLTSGITLPSCTYTNYNKTLYCPNATFLTSVAVGDNIIITTNTTKYTGYVQSVNDNENLVFVWHLLTSPTINATGYISGTTLTITNTYYRVIVPGTVITGTGIESGTTIVNQLTGITGSTGTYRVSISQNVPSTAISSPGQPDTLISNQITNLQKTRKADVTTISGVTGAWAYSGGCLAPNGKIYCMPYNAQNVLIIDPSNNTSTTVPMVGTSQQYRCAIMAQDGNIYGIPCNENKVCVINPNTNGLSYIISAGSDTLKWFGGVLAPNGIIYCAPFSSSSVLQIKTGLPAIPDWVLQSYFNKF